MDISTTTTSLPNHAVKHYFPLLIVFVCRRSEQDEHDVHQDTGGPRRHPNEVHRHATITGGDCRPGEGPETKRRQQRAHVVGVGGERGRLLQGVHEAAVGDDGGEERRVRQHRGAVPTEPGRPGAADRHVQRGAERAGAENARKRRTGVAVQQVRAGERKPHRLVDTGVLLLDTDYCILVVWVFEGILYSGHFVY